MKYLNVGKIVTTHGIKGEVKVKVETDDNSRFGKGSKLYLGMDEKHINTEITVDNARYQKEMILLSFNNNKDINEVQKYVGMSLYVDIDEVREEGEIYYDDLIDCKVIVNNEVIGIVTDVMEVPQGEILRVKKQNGKTALIPYVDEFIENVDINKKEIVVNPIEGLL
ncbi:MAG: 16S rRNA processing protein RimM [Bacilli bacterium]|nr:16S rRNA processing protein RimM [Bacilli bacterium]